MDNDNKELSLSNKNLELITSNVNSTLQNGSWYKEGDYYYFIEKVKNGNEINLIKGIKFAILNDEENYNINEYQNKKIGIKVTMEMVQSTGEAYKARWNSSGNNLTDDLIVKLDSLVTKPKQIN